MPRFLATARYCTRGGNPGHWSGSIEAGDIHRALRQAQAIVEKRHRGASKIDITVVPDRRSHPVR
jgi:hypothetical protein